MKKENNKISKKLLIFFTSIGIVILIIFLSLYYILSIKDKVEIYSITVKGYDMNVKFNPKIYEYNVVVNNNIVDIVCDTNYEIEGCNVSLDLSEKNIYNHVIKFSNNSKKSEYVINIRKEMKEENNDFFIKSVNGNVNKWTNQDVNLEVILSRSGQFNYSFDNGNSWQDNNRYTVSSNGVFQIIARNSEGKLSEPVNIEVNKIDKEKPQIVINKLKTNNSSVILEVVANDPISGVDTISFNGGNFTNKTKYEIFKTGKYYFEVRDKAGNTTDKIYIEITDDDIKKVEEKTYTLTLNKNGSQVEKNSISCSTTGNSCYVILPKIITNYDVIGWATSGNAESANYLVGSKLELTGNMTLYAITKRTFTATFSNQGLDYLSASSLSCTAYNGVNSCYITLPYFNKKGHFNSFWSEKSEVSSNLSGKKWDWAYFKQAGRVYELTGNVTLYPNFNQFHYDLTKNCYKYRTLNVSTTKFIGNTMFEFESGIPTTVINNFMNSMNQAYKIMPWLFTPGKVFIMTESTYDNYSTAYGLNHSMYKAYGGDSYFTIDLKYDTSGSVVKNAIDINAALHELAHAWDSYFYYRTDIKNGISSTNDFDKFYNSIRSKLYVDNTGSVISKVETFAGMVTNYYWHVLGMDKSKAHYALKNGIVLDSNELYNLKSFMEKYINISKNNYIVFTIY